VTIGANDLVPLTGSWEDGGCDTACATPAVEAMERGLDGDLALLETLTPAHTTVLVTSYWNVFEDGDVADATRGPGFAGWSDGVTKLANTAICRAAVAASDTCVDLYEPFEGSDGTQNPTNLLAADGDHPNAAGHDLIARALLAATPS
jgi:lysophospholipase L1-like esterase